ncbi:zinc finger protein [Saccharothrix lopnurensis]|uniref:Zinc finger protein n=1 Tax=Saccharothrix lopnurensis TaxID=1670621 RepID=A0ABW1P571_9PSEU
MALRPFRWLPHNGKRHAVPEHVVAHDEATTLCGEELVVPVRRASNLAWCWPTCAECDAAWRQVERIPAFPRQRNAGSRAHGGSRRDHPVR